MSLLNLAERMVETCSKVGNTYDKHGDQVFGVVTASLPCLYRPMTTLQPATNAEQVTIEGTFWLRPADGWERGDIILFEGVYYRIDRLITARRRLVDNSIQFLKAEVYRTRQVS
jgi:hypothetical protein